ncbi:MAG: DNA polymerase III subunit delta' [Syntrophales bacterium]|nr:DNA polymerase III subunit delta' [Syntrophales bacterium]
MSYRAIHGHARNIAFLQGAIVQDRVAHAYLFAGMEGIGKGTVATAFAKALMCPNGEDGDACGVCPTCAKIDRGNHPDVITIVPEGPFIKIQAIRDLIDLMAFPPFEGNRRVIIMDEADRLNVQAANALLKTLEEPSRAHVLILVTARMRQLPATILSRCQRLFFSPLSRQEIAAYLVAHLGVAEGEALLLAGGSGGSIKRAIELKKGDYLGRRETILSLLQAEAARPLKLLALANYLGGEKDHLIEALEILKSCFRDAIVYRELQNGKALVFGDREATIRKISDGLTSEALLANVRFLDGAIRSLERNANKTLTLEATVFSLIL